jgi:GTP-binding protein LepA
MDQIRNFAIIAHIDHGKSTLADRLLEITGLVEKNKHEEQLLDRNPISRERGITIKLAPVVMSYKGYILNLIDTPGHVDFSYEVERTLACVEGVILLVDATQGIQAQTIAHTYKALEQNLTIIPVINKIDMPAADVEKTKREMVEFLGCREDEIFQISAKTGLNVESLLDTVIEKIPSPKINLETEATKALIFDSYYDQYRGVIAFVRVVDGELRAGKKVKLFASNVFFEIIEVGIFNPELKKKETLRSGEIGYVVTNLKDIHQVAVGDTMLDIKDMSGPLPGYKKVKPMVFASMFTVDPDDYLQLKKSLEKLTLNDSALSYEGIYSQALGSGFKVGFLGLLHADVVRERLEREFDLQLVLTPPVVEYLPVPIEEAEGRAYRFLEPITEVSVVAPQEYTGAIMRLCEDSRGEFVTMDNKTQTYLVYKMPLSELITNFFDNLKTVSSGYASLDWHFSEYRMVDADKMQILLNGDPVEEFSEYVVSERAFTRVQEMTTKLKNIIPRQQYEVKIQAFFKGKVIASDRIAPFRKDVTAKLYGGDRTRKDKLLKKQKAGKKLMKNVGTVEIPKEAFFKLFKK